MERRDLRMKAGEEGKEIKEFHKEGTEHDRMKTRQKRCDREERKELKDGQEKVE